MTAHGYGPHIQAMAAVVADIVRVRAVDIHAIDLAAFQDGARLCEVFRSNPEMFGAWMALGLFGMLVQSRFTARDGGKRGSSSDD